MTSDYTQAMRIAEWPSQEHLRILRHFARRGKRIWNLEYEDTMQELLIKLHRLTDQELYPSKAYVWAAIKYSLIDIARAKLSIRCLAKTQQGLERFRRRQIASSPISLEDPSLADFAPAVPRPSQAAHDLDAIEAMLDPRDAQIISRLRKGATQVEVARSIGVTPSRVCQILSRICQRIQKTELHS